MFSKKKGGGGLIFWNTLAPDVNPSFNSVNVYNSLNRIVFAKTGESQK